MDSLNRFIDAQASDFDTAWSEIKQGRKRSHWMWYIFPQIQGLGATSTSKYYAIKDLHEAAAYFAHPILGSRLLQISQTLLGLPEKSATAIFGSPDDLKLKSCMTLFAALPNSNPVFEQVLDKFYKGTKDGKTLLQIKQNI